MTSGPGNRVCIDIGSCAIKILQASGPADKPVVTAIGSRGVIGVSGPGVSETLRSLSDEKKISAKDAYISLSGPSVIVRFISLPKMDEAALKGAIRYEAEKFIPYDISDCIVDYQTLRKDDKENKLNILLVAAKKEFVHERIRLVENAGFAVKVIDVDSFALANAFLKNNASTDPDKSYAVLNMGGLHTNMSILKGGSIYFSRDIVVGGNDFTSAIAKKLGIDQIAAEELKVQCPKEKEKDVADCVKGVFSDLLDEVKLSFGYYENQGGKVIDEIYVSGGASAIINLEQAFEETLGSKPVFWNPLGFLDISSSGIDLGLLETMERSFSVAAGLALR